MDTIINERKMEKYMSFEIRLVEYDHSFAAKVAEMWNVSKDGWNGEADHMTEQSVRQKEEVSTHLNLYLALLGEKVVGYCKLSRYFFDDNTLYIDLLNVDPAYHGKKIGKLLVLKAVEKTIELGYPRLDLFTWAGNTKAVPLYKKCGFFWEKMETGSTHLMNYIPYVMNCELFADYFENVDWYNDSDRIIEVEPDGRTENNFDFLGYSWKKDGENLVVEFEKSGRGVTYVETNDYSIRAIVENNKLVFGKQYDVNYEIINKSGNELFVEIIGQENKNIVNNVRFEGYVSGKETVSGRFDLGKIETDQSLWNTHPVVQAEFKINGKSITFKTGINPQFPLKINFVEGYDLYEENVLNTFNINVENNYDEECSFEVTLPNIDEIKFVEPVLNFSLKSKERSSISIDAILNNSVNFYDDVDITAKFSDGRITNFTKKLILVNYTSNGSSTGVSNYYYLMNIGKYSFSFDKEMEYNEMVFRSIITGVWCFIGNPKVGKPFTDEYMRKAPYKHEYIKSYDSILFKCYYISENIQGLEFSQSFNMKRNGMLEQWYEIEKFPQDKEEIVISCSMNLDRSNLVIPYQNKIVKTNGSKHNDDSLDSYDSTKISENWLYNEVNGKSIAFFWEKDCKFEICSWDFSLSRKFTKDVLKSEPIVFAIDTFKNIRKVRSHALGKIVNHERIYDSFELEINNGNPFCENEISGSFVDFKTSPIDGIFKISSNDNSVEKEFTNEDNCHKIDYNFDNFASPVEIVKLDADFRVQEITKIKAAFSKGNGSVYKTEEKNGKINVLSIENEFIKFKSSAEFAPNIFSLTYKGNEWLHSDFPERTCKSWWSPWYGGMANKPANVKEHHMLAEQTITEFASRIDNFGNKWEGISIATTFNKLDKFKGITLKQYFLTLPNCPVITSFVEASLSDGFAVKLTVFTGNMFVKPDSLNELSIVSKDEGCEFNIKCGYEGIDSLVSSNLMTHKALNRDEKFYFFNGNPASSGSTSTDNAVATSNFEEIRMITKNKPEIYPPVFVIFSEHDLTEEMLVDLQNVRF
ncbi:MAG: GNAT family N-acetyltransferase [Candidatus Delongbacteria bacterium]|nr:GNAT family N-acetyltransferase [Candidatus Delongbacteria bacterium]MBN2835945.1 GNAT family N-acetyltransferase [Candidatus Delongbacteria bacterium]